MNEIDLYIESFPSETQEKLREIRQIIKNAAPLATEVLELSMRMIAYDLNGRWLVHFIVYEKHIDFCPQPEGIIAFKDRLNDYKTSKGTIQFPLNKPLPLDLIKDIVEYRVKEQMQ